jgi:ATP-dependent Clp protease adaptor protein ClpS
MKTKKLTRVQPEKWESTDASPSSSRFLVLHNDDYHTFDFVIETLVDVCDHDAIQAEQCAYIVHYKGKCDVKEGTYTALEPMRSQLVDRGLKATID